MDVHCKHAIDMHATTCTGSQKQGKQPAMGLLSHTLDSSNSAKRTPNPPLKTSAGQCMQLTPTQLQVP